MARKSFSEKSAQEIQDFYEHIWDLAVPTTGEILVLLHSVGTVCLDPDNVNVFYLYSEERFLAFRGRKQAWDWWLIRHAPGSFQVPEKGRNPWQLPAVDSVPASCLTA